MNAAGELPSWPACPACRCVVKEATPQQFLELALVENIQRADLNPLEEAEAFQALMNDFGLNQQEVAEKVGKSRVAVANTLRLLRLPEPVKRCWPKDASDRRTRPRAARASGKRTHRQGCRAGGGARGLNVRQTEDLVRRLLACGRYVPPNRKTRDNDDDPDDLHTRHLEDEFRNALGTKVALTGAAAAEDW